MSAPLNPETAAEIQTIASQCVMCGLCLPHCPSYRVEQNEADSPRGRLALMAMLAASQLADASTASLDRCLACGQCERVCPAQVKYGRALAAFRSKVAPTNESWLGRGARMLTRRPRTAASAIRALVAVRALLPRNVRRRLNLDGVARLRYATRPMPTRPAPAGARAATVVLAGCAGDALEAQAIAALERIATLSARPLRVDRDACCGALAAHLGQPPDALQAAPGGAQGAQLVVINSGCTAQWQQRLAGQQVLGVAAWIEQAVSELGAPPRSQPLRVALHLPCSQRSLAGEEQSLRRLLARLPGVQLIDCAAQPTCCGAAGSYFLNQPNAARRLADEVAAGLVGLDVDVVVSSNGGCRAQIAQSIVDAGSELRILHPAELVSECLESRA